MVGTLTASDEGRNGAGELVRNFATASSGTVAFPPGTTRKDLEATGAKGVGGVATEEKGTQPPGRRRRTHASVGRRFCLSVCNARTIRSGCEWEHRLAVVVVNHGPMPDAHDIVDLAHKGGLQRFNIGPGDRAFDRAPEYAARGRAKIHVVFLSMISFWISTIWIGANNPCNNRDLRRHCLTATINATQFSGLSMKDPM